MDEKPLMMEIMHIHKEWQNYMKKIAQESGIPESYRMIIMFLSRNPGVSQKEVAAFCGTTYAAVSQTIKEMHLTGFIRKETSASDQRYSMLYLTDKGTEYAMKTVEKFKAADAKITETLGYENERRMASEIKKLSEVIKKEL
ncbi:MAG: winged helix-turn-helix transcriptional regulator [Ruminococcaceae bacterium]|nr:winged helix-turn-helix transcriptional regulator [Oscillospiraceae bacterium]